MTQCGPESSGPERISVRWIVGLALFAALAGLPMLHLALHQGRPWSFAAIAGIAVAAAAVVARRSGFAATSIIATSLFLQLGYVAIGYSDQIDLGRLAMERASDGDSPYGVMYVNRTGGSNPFAYGPVAMLTAQLGVPLEMASSLGLLGIVAATRSWVTLCVVAGFPPYIYQAATGINDYSVALLLLGGLLLLRQYPIAGVVLIAVAGAVKPYVGLWYLPVIGYAGWVGGTWLLAASAILWSPLIIWGLASYIESLRLVVTAPTPQGWPSNSIAIPIVRWLAIPISALGLLARRWEIAVLIGSAAFAAFMFFGEWASLGYWVVLLPVTGVAFEMIARERWDEDLSRVPSNHRRPGAAI